MRNTVKFYSAKDLALFLIELVNQGFGFSVQTEFDGDRQEYTVDF